MAETKKTNTGSKKKKATASNSKTKKKTTSTSKAGAKKTTTKSSPAKAKTKKSKTTGSAKKKKAAASSKKKSTSGKNKSKIKVRVTKEDISGIEESMEESKEAVFSAEKEEKKSPASKKTPDKKIKTPEIDFKDKDGNAEKKEKRVKKDDFKKRVIGGDDKGGGKSSDLSIKPKSISLYKKIAFTFIVLTLLLVGAVCYFSFVNLTITITPTEERVSDNMMVNIYDKSQEGIGALSGSDVVGAVEVLDIQKEGTYQSTGEEIVGKEIRGRVEIINNYSQNQPLVETTRLLSPNNKLYRIEETVNVPAGGSVEVGIYSEEPSPEMAIGPTEFTIPGLWAGLQDEIYAKSVEGFTYKTPKRIFIQETDIDRAISDLKQKLRDDIEHRFANGYKGYKHVVYSIEEDSVSVEMDKEAGEESEDFNIAIEAKIDIVAFDNDKIVDIAKKRLVARLPGDKRLSDFNKDNMNYSINNFNFNDKVATVDVNFNGKMVLAENSQIIDRKKILGLNKEQLKDYLNSFDQIESYKINFTPSFIDEAPTLVDRIKVKIQN
jgi:hypothetical protein